MNPIKFCENLNLCRTKANLSFTDLSDRLAAKQVYVSASTLQRYESGKIKNVPYDVIGVIAEVLEVSPVALLGYTEISFHRNPEIDERFTDFISECYSRQSTMTLDGKSLTSKDIQLLEIMMTDCLNTYRRIINMEK